MSKNEVTQRRLIDHLKMPHNVLKINIASITHLTGNKNSLVKVEVMLTDMRGMVVSDSFFATECTKNDKSSFFETESCELSP